MKRKKATNCAKDQKLNWYIDSLLADMLLAAGPHSLWLPALPKQAACSPSSWAEPLTQAVQTPRYCQLSISDISTFPFSLLSSWITKQNLHSQLLFQVSAWLCYMAELKAGMWKHGTIQPATPAWKVPVQA